MSAGARPPTHACSTTTSRRPSRRVRAGRRRPCGRRAPAVRPSASAARSTASASCDGIMAVRRNAMTTETYDWPAIVEGLNRYLRLRSIPIGMKLFETVEAMEAIPKIRRPKVRHTTDQIVAQARQLGWTVGITMADLIGAQCGAVIGLHPQDDELLMAIPPRFLPKVIEGLAALDKNGLRYPIPPYGIQSDAGAGLAVSYADKETSKKA